MEFKVCFFSGQRKQTLDLQVDALKQKGCENIYTDKVSGVKAIKPAFDKMLNFMREGDTIVVWKLDRLGRSTKDLIELVATLEKRKINLTFA